MFKADMNNSELVNFVAYIVNSPIKNDDLKAYYLKSFMLNHLDSSKIEEYVAEDIGRGV